MAKDEAGPAKSDRKPRTTVVGVRLDDETLAWLDAKAKAKDRTRAGQLAYIIRATKSTNP